MMIGRDITEQKEVEREKAALQERLQQAQKMEAIGALAGGIAHDFNNILSSILGFAELADLDIPENTKAKHNLQQSMKGALRAKDLVQQILAFSRQGKQERKPLNIKPIIKEGLKFLRASLPSTIEIRQNIEEDLGVIEADPTQIHQVLMNLCTNAAHAMDQNGGILDVSLRNLDVDGETSLSAMGVQPGPYLRLRVSDTGYGIPPETLKKIFDPYFTTKEVGKGTGLGLAVVHGIVKSYGGGIALSSEVGKGSTFDIYFPRIGGESTSSDTGEGEPIPRGKHERILLVDDEEMIVEIGRNFLEHLGYEVAARTGSVGALELFRVQSARFDLVITDMTMPNMPGDKLAQELLRIRPEIPIILCTGFSEHITEEKAKAMGIRGFVKKPLVMRELGKAVRSVLDSPMESKMGSPP
jgi:nitrogen-specific signal transduction histidine kinase/CheY-like chemotaxis protein